jgi:hypothetical protein
MTKGNSAIHKPRTYVRRLPATCYNVGMSESTLARMSLARTFAALVLGLTVGPETVWLGLRVKIPMSEPGATHEANHSVAALIESPTFRSEPLAGLASHDPRP